MVLITGRSQGPNLELSVECRGLSLNQNDGLFEEKDAKKVKGEKLRNDNLQKAEN